MDGFRSSSDHDKKNKGPMVTPGLAGFPLQQWMIFALGLTDIMIMTESLNTSTAERVKLPNLFISVPNYKQLAVAHSMMQASCAQICFIARQLTCCS